MLVDIQLSDILRSLSVEKQEQLAGLLEEKRQEREIARKRRSDPWRKHQRQLGFSATGNVGDCVVAEEKAPYGFKGMKLICRDSAASAGTVIKSVTVAGKTIDLNKTTDQFTKDTMLHDQWWEPIKKGEKISFFIEFVSACKWQAALIGRKFDWRKRK